jgi:hypothetical protein
MKMTTSIPRIYADQRELKHHDSQTLRVQERKERIRENPRGSADKKLQAMG